MLSFLLIALSILSVVVTDMMTGIRCDCACRKIEDEACGVLAKSHSMSLLIMDEQEFHHSMIWNVLRFPYSVKKQAVCLC